MWERSENGAEGEVVVNSQAKGPHLDEPLERVKPPKK